MESNVIQMGPKALINPKQKQVERIRTHVHVAEIPPNALNTWPRSSGQVLKLGIGHKSSNQAVAAALHLFYWNVSGVKTCRSPTTLTNHRITFTRKSDELWEQGRWCDDNFSRR